MQSPAAGLPGNRLVCILLFTQWGCIRLEDGWQGGEAAVAATMEMMNSVQFANQQPYTVTITITNTPNPTP
jgi:hypothetical protein